MGRTDGVEVRHIVGAIANEGDINSRYIGNIKLFDTHSTIELPKGMPTDLLQHFTRTRVMNKPMNMTLVGDAKPFNRERRSGGNDRGGNGGRSFGGGNRRDGERSDRGNSDRRPQGERRSFRREEGGNSAPRRRSNNDA